MENLLLFGMVGLCSRCQTQPRRKGGRYCLACHNQYDHEHPRVRKTTPYNGPKDNPRSKAYYAQRHGKLVPVPCGCGCGTPLDRLQKHHEDYDRPLDVVFCCAKEHRRLDAARAARLLCAHVQKAPRPASDRADC